MPIGSAQRRAGVPPPPPTPSFLSDPYAIFDATGTPSLSRASLRLDADGKVRQIRQNQADGDIGFWGSGLTISDYDFMMEQITGSVSAVGTQALDVWIQGFGGMYWGVETTFGTPNFTATLRVRPFGGGADFDTAFCDVNAEAT